MASLSWRSRAELVFFGLQSAARIGSVPRRLRASGIQYLTTRRRLLVRAPAAELMSRIAVVRAAVPGHAALAPWALLGLVVVAGSVALRCDRRNQRRADSPEPRAPRRLRLPRGWTRIPRPALLVALLATLNALAWGLILRRSRA